MSDMGLNDTVSAERVHIGFFGRRNAGKSSLVNAVTGQTVSVVSETMGTTTDPVKKAMELLPIGPVLITDTPGFDDSGDLGDKRVGRTRETIAHTDIAVLVTDRPGELSRDETEFLDQMRKRGTPCITVHNKADLMSEVPESSGTEIWVSAETGLNIRELKEMIGRLAPSPTDRRTILGDLVSEGDNVILVTPIDSSAPKGRIILPQQQTLRELLDFRCTASVCQPEQLGGLIASLKEPPRMVITDSQAFSKVAAVVPDSVPLTSFSILFSRYKGSLRQQAEGAAFLPRLKDGDRVLIAEGCTHHRQCEDIGTVKIPSMIRKVYGVSPEFSFTSGGEFPEDLKGYKLIIHCGACMLNEAEVRSRMERASAAGVPVVNYGIALAMMSGVLKRSTELFPDIHSML